MCLFPKRALIETSALLSYIDMTPHNGESYDLPPNDFMKQYFRFEDLIQHNIAFLYPINTREETHKLDGTIFDSTSIIPLKNVANVSQNGNLSRILQRPDMFYMAFLGYILQEQMILLRYVTNIHQNLIALQMQ